MGTNQQLTTEQLELLKFLYEVEVEKKSNKHIKASNDEIISEYIRNEAEIITREKVSTVKKCLIRIAQMFVNKEDDKEKECKEEHSEKKLREIEVLEDSWNNLKQYDFIDVEGNLTTEGKQIVLIAFDDKKKEEYEKTEKRKEKLFDILSSILGK